MGMTLDEFALWERQAERIAEQRQQQENECG